MSSSSRERLKVLSTHVGVVTPVAVLIVVEVVIGFPIEKKLKKKRNPFHFLYNIVNRISFLGKYKSNYMVFSL